MTGNLRLIYQMQETQEIQKINIPSWTDLTTQQQQAVIALCLSSGRVNKASALYKASTGFSRAQFYQTVYPAIKAYWKDLSPKVPEQALMLLQAGSVGAAYELVKEIEHKDVRIRNKAANDVLDKALPKRESLGVSVKDGDKEFKFVVSRGE